MIDIYSIPLYYISFQPKPILEKQFSKFGYSNINHFTAINGKKYNPKQLVKSNMISIRAYMDLVNGRESHNGISSLGAIGCALSNYTLWMKCIQENLPYIIISEDDVVLSKLTVDDENNIRNTLQQGGLYTSVEMSSVIAGTQFYFVSQDACKTLVKSFFPIETQVDWFMFHLYEMDMLNMNGHRFVTQVHHSSSIQDRCFKCLIPHDPQFYILLGVFVIITGLCIGISMRTCD